jgi:hypothetical protein
LQPRKFRWQLFKNPQVIFAGYRQFREVVQFEKMQDIAFSDVATSGNTSGFLAAGD